MDNLAHFTITRLPRILFGSGRISELPALIAAYGQHTLIVTGERSFRATAQWPALTRALAEHKIHYDELRVSGEPSPQFVDDAVAHFHTHNIKSVIGIGGGSVLDAAKAIAGLLPYGNSVLDHLENVGRNIPYHGPALPFIAVPTTAGTGSEATKNAVLSVSGEHGYKKSFRHETLVPEYALIDPDLLATCPSVLIAADGMDAFTQLLESFVSIKANYFTDALAWSGMEAVHQGFFAALADTMTDNGADKGKGADAAIGRAWMAYASLLSGITLAQVGLGSVHGLASPLGAFFPIPHGVVCGTLVAAATQINITALRARAPHHAALAKYARVGRLLDNNPEMSDAQAQDYLVSRLSHWTEQLALPRLSYFGVRDSDIPRIVANSRGSSMTTNPLVLHDTEIAAIVQARL